MLCRIKPSVPSPGTGFLLVACLGVGLLAGCGGGDGTSSVADAITPAASCFDSDLYKAGATADAHYAVTDASGAAGTRTLAWRVAGETATYNGVDGLAAVWVRDVIDYPASAGAAGSSDGSTLTSFVTSVAPGVLRVYGSVAVPTASGVTGTVSTAYSPALDDSRGLMWPGETRTVRRQGTRNAMTSSGSQTTTFDETEVIRFVGRETLDLPGGRFTACRFEIGAPLQRTEWIAHGLRVQELRVAHNERSTLTQLAVNGQALP